MKRLFDLIGAGSLLLLLAPVLLLLALAVRVRLGSPVLFRQLRPGRFGQPFRMVKFRTMTDARDANGQLLSDAERLTPLGCVLRRYSLDELPELINVLRGEMSLVGPRPLLMEYLPYYTAEERRRHDVRPGITGWAQINGRNHLPWAQRLALDIWYVDHRTFGLDLLILLKTVGKVLCRDGVAVDPDEVETNLHEERGSQTLKPTADDRLVSAG